MYMWLRLSGVSLAVVGLLVCLDYYGVLSLAGDSSAERAEATAHRTRELFWQVIFLLVWLTAVWAAARRMLERLMPRRA